MIRQSADIQGWEGIRGKGYDAEEKVPNNKSKGNR